MASDNTFYRDIASALLALLFALGCFAFAIWMIFLLLFPAAKPAFLVEIEAGIDAWSSAHPKEVTGIAVFLFIGALGWTLASFQTETHDKLNALEKQLTSIAEDVAEIKSELRDLDRKI